MSTGINVKSESQDNLDISVLLFKVKEAISKTLIRNGMFDSALIRLSLTRGKKVTSGMSPGFNLYGCTLIGNRSKHFLTNHKFGAFWTIPCLKCWTLLSPPTLEEGL